MISSEGIQNNVHEGTHISTSEGKDNITNTTTEFTSVVDKLSAPSLQQDASKDLMRVIKLTQVRQNKTKPSTVKIIEHLCWMSPKKQVVRIGIEIDIRE